MQFLSHSIPIIAIQVNMIEVCGNKSLHFSKILDTYEEPDNGVSNDEIYDEAFWKKKSTWSIDTAKVLLETVGDIFDSASLSYVKNYIAINVFGNNFFWLHKRSANKFLLGFRILDEYIEEVSQLLDEQSISFVQKRNRFRVTVDKNFISGHPELLKQVAEFIKKHCGNNSESGKREFL